MSNSASDGTLFGEIARVEIAELEAAIRHHGEAVGRLVAAIGDIRRDLDVPAGKLTLDLGGEGAQRLRVHGSLALVAADADRSVYSRGQTVVLSL